ncbi:MAG: tRNA (guanosine(37)-N1)-methyltransferase TrmD, partial [Candidatus Omnitrophota bacterium]
PDMFQAITCESIVKRALAAGKIEINLYNIRDFSDDEKHSKVDDKPFGGGPGMVLKCQPVLEALRELKSDSEDAKVILLAPHGKVLNQEAVKSFSNEKHMILVAGHYEGFDERICESVDEILSIGDYILTGGEIPAMVFIDTVIRYVPGVLGAEESAYDESFQNGLLEYPQYTRPADYNGKKVPDVLMSGNHKEIQSWRKSKSILRTIEQRPDLIKNFKQLEL